jgi:tetratricopeptide (TPR) repeat protein
MSRSGVVALAVLAVLAPASHADEPGSLEDFLSRARAEREKVQAALKGPVEAIVRELEATDRNTNAKRLRELVDRAVALGPDATPLLVEFIDPGDAALDGERWRATQVATALSRMDTTPVTARLLALLRDGSLEGRRNSVRGLAGSLADSRVRPALTAAFHASQGSLRQTILRALIAAGGPETDALLGEVLASGDGALVSLALTGLAETGAAGSADRVRKILFDASLSKAHARELLQYLRACPQVVGEAEIAALCRIARDGPPLDVRIQVLDALPEFKPPLNAELKRALEPLTVPTNDRALREAALIALTTLGDKGARKDLLRPYDDAVDQNEGRFAEPYSRRAQIHFRIGDYDAAIKDNIAAIKAGVDDPTLKPDTYVALARCYARKGKVKEAAEWVRKAPISISQLRALADDPDFRELRDSKYGRDAFGLEE